MAILIGHVSLEKMERQVIQLEIRPGKKYTQVNGIEVYLNLGIL